MHRLSFYVLRQIIGPLFLFTFLITTIIWLTQSLRLLDLVINRGQSAAVFTYLSLLMLPSLLTIVVPIAFFAGALYALNRLNGDSELVVMWAAGFSRAQLAVPLLVAAAFAMACTYACNLYLAPLSQRTMKDRVFDIRNDIGAAILREGAFTTPSEGLTVFLREMTADGQIRGLLVHDSSNANRPITYIAQKGVLAQTEAGARLIMFDGDIEQVEDNGQRLSVLKFEQYALDLDKYASPERTSLRDTRERYLSELFHPETQGAASTGNVQRRKDSYLAEAHNRLSAPLYCIVFALISLAATCKGRLNRLGYALRLIWAVLCGVGLRIVGYSVQGLAADNPKLIPALYILPIAGILIAAFCVTDLYILPRRHIPEREPAP